MDGWTRWCFHHKWVVILVWVVALVGLGGAGTSLGSKYENVFDLPGTDSSKAMSLMEKAFPDQSGESDTVVWRVGSGSVRDAAVRERMTGALERVGKLPDVASVGSPYAKDGAAQISENGRIAYATVNFAKPGEKLTVEQMKKVVDTARAPAGDGLDIELGGNAVQLTEDAPAHLSELVGIVAAAVILFFAFGSLFGMLLPIITAVFAVGIGSFVISLLSHGMAIGELSPIFSVLIGLGVGIDYALFIVTRHRKGILQGKTPEDAAAEAVDTSGRAVLFAGGTVCIALLGMFVLGVTFLNGLAVACALTVVIAVCAAVTLLPALLGVFGERVLSRRQRRRLAANGPQSEGVSGPAARWADFVERRPKALALVAVVVLATLAVPALSLRLGTSDQGNNVASTTTRKAYDMLADGFGPGFNGPFQVVAEVPDESGRRALERLVSGLEKDRGVAQVQAMPLRPGDRTAIMQVFPTTSPQSEETDDLIDRVRSDIIPAAERGSDMQAYVGGITAIYKDFSSTLQSKLPLFIGVIVALGFVLLLVAFRSLVVPLTAAVMNLVAAAASFGVLVALFQWGWGGEGLSAGRAGPIDAFLPVIMLSLLFGLSMDYQVFLVSRMHEEWVHTEGNARAVRVGLASISRVIAAAAVIMVGVFSAIMLSGERVTAMFGLGLAAAVILDAFIVRLVLVPALMHLFGKANWWLPAAIDKRLPQFAVEPPPAATGSGQPRGTAPKEPVASAPNR